MPPDGVLPTAQRLRPRRGGVAVYVHPALRALLPAVRLVTQRVWLAVIVAGKGPAFDIIATFAEQAVPSGEQVPDTGDVLLSVQYDRIIPQETIDGYSQVLNLHFGPLPNLRGCFPTKWAIINNEPAGVTLHHIDAGVDTGPVVDVRTFDCSTMTDLQVYETCNRLAVGLFMKWRQFIMQGIVPPGVAQVEEFAKYYPRRLPFDGVLPAGCPPDLEERLERAFTHPPYPGLAR